MKGYTQFGGKHHETAGLRNMLLQQGVVAPRTGKPLSEAMVLGIGGGLGGGYWLFEMCGGTWLVLGFRHKWQGYEPFVKNTFERLGKSVTVQETGSKKAAAANLRQAIDNGQSAFVWVDRASLPYHGLPESLKKCFLYSVVACGLDDDAVLVDDLAATPWHVPADVFADARATQPYMKNRLLVVDSAAQVTADQFQSAVLDGIRVGCAELLEPPIKNFGVPAIKKWADLVANPRDKKGWPSQFPPGPMLYSILVQLYENIETNDTPGGAFRGMYADFLDEASEVLERPALRDIAHRYREIATQWHDLAESALPDGIGPFERAKGLLRERQRVFASQGSGGAQELARLNSQLESLSAEVGAAFPLSKDDAQALLADFRNRLLMLYEAEVLAATALRAEVC